MAITSPPHVDPVQKIGLRASVSQFGTWLRVAIKALLAVLLVGVPALFPKSIDLSEGSKFSWPLAAFAALMVAVAVWEAVDKIRENKEKQRQQQEAHETIRSLETKLKDAQFAQEYTDALANSVNAIQYLDSYGPQDLDIAIRSFLDTVRAVVALNMDDVKDLQLNVSVMRPIPFTEERCREIGSDLFFLAADRVPTTYEAILQTTHWATDNHTVPDNFSLPVHHNREKLLFGAPESYKKGIMQHVADVTDQAEMERLIRNQPDDVRLAIRVFFQNREYNSFASIRLEYASKIIGVMNISSNRPKVFENVVNREDNFQRYIRPLAAMTALALTYRKGENAQ